MPAPRRRTARPMAVPGARRSWRERDSRSQLAASIQAAGADPSLPQIARPLRSAPLERRSSHCRLSCDRVDSPPRRPGASSSDPSRAGSRAFSLSSIAMFVRMDVCVYCSFCASAPQPPLISQQDHPGQSPGSAVDRRSQPSGGSESSGSAPCQIDSCRPTWSPRWTPSAPNVNLASKTRL